MSYCSYPSPVATAFEYTHLIPWIVPLVITAASIGKDRTGKWGKQIILIWYGSFLFVCQIGLYIAQASFNVTRTDPYCIDVVSYAFPSTEGFYISALSTYVIVFTYLWNIPLSWSYWTILFVFVIGPSGILVWFTYNTLAEIGISVGIGSGTTIIFLLFVRFLWIDDIKFFVLQAPWTWLNAIDSYVQTDIQLIEASRTEFIVKKLEKEEYPDI